MVSRFDPACARDNSSLSFGGACVGSAFDAMTEFYVLWSKPLLAVSQTPEDFLCHIMESRLHHNRPVAGQWLVPKFRPRICGPQHRDAKEECRSATRELLDLRGHGCLCTGLSPMPFA